MKQTTTIFKELILNIIIPTVLALLLLGVLNFQHTKNILIKSSSEKNHIISDEITHVLEFQDVALGVLESSLDKKMEMYSNKLINNYFKNTDNIDKADLYKIRDELGMNPNFEDIYVINSKGIVVNTTFKEDLNLNFFDFGEEHKNHLLNVLNDNKFVSERFVIENQTRRLKKYTYQPTNDNKYIIELGVYSLKADEIIDFIRNTTHDIAKKQESIESVDLFIWADKPISLDINTSLKESHNSLLVQVFNNKDTSVRSEKENGKRLQYEYIYMDRKNTDLYKGSVIRIISDKTGEQKVLRTELLKFFIIFILTLSAVIFLISRKTKVITDPIKRLVANVNRITNGHMNERADVIGNNEIATLSVKFNNMITELESYYNELEQKVRERTAEVVRQKDEIVKQRDEIAEHQKHITDSIKYAKRIQTAILPPDDYINKNLPNSFILYLPKDIVSGDFYWMEKRESNVMIAAVDCTGHGVPGAFMSIVGNNQLNYAVNVKKARKPSDILNELNKGVTYSLRQKKGVSNVKDGMDIALCTIDYENKKLQYAGAYNPLYFIRNNEFVKIKGDKFPIGAFIDENIQEYTNHDIDIQEGDIIYIFSDGYADQFGGPDSRKFMYKPFRELLIKIHNKPMDEQKEILEKVLSDWKGNETQVDDILVIGIKI
ncbi:MAG: SpoIIE family protein phosphatase [Bacteroidales bacterium]|nr:SpoIIE family protein phosphatase [Bacteroidales bacterium]